MVVGEVQRADLIDPLHGFSVLSLLPRASKGFKRSENSEQGDMEFIHSCLKLMETESSVKLVEQAKTIYDNTSEVKDSEISHYIPIGDDTMIYSKVKDRPQERRPALGRKRARFSLKPNMSSQPSLEENVNMNIDQLDDPEDFFLAYEKLENAKKELQKQRGDNLADVTTHNISTTTRIRRPGLLGKTVGYKHHYSSVLVDSDEAVVSSQEAPEVNIPNHSNSSDERTDEFVTLKERDLASYGPDDVIQGKGSVAKEEEKGSRLLDELLSTNCSDLDKDGAVAFLQDRLQIKPINLDKLCLPNMDSFQKIDSKAAGEHREPRKALSDIHNKLRRVSNRTTEVHQVAERSMLQRASPAPSKSPLSSMVLLNKRISKMDNPVNPFSFHGIDTSPATHCSPPEGIERHDVSPNVDYDNNNANDTTSQELNGVGLSFSGRFQSLMHEEDKAEDSNMVSVLPVAENLADKPAMSADDGSNRFNMDMVSSSNKSDDDRREVSPNIARDRIDANGNKLESSLNVDCDRNDAHDIRPTELNEKDLDLCGRIQSPMLQTYVEAKTVASEKLVPENMAQSLDIPMDEGSNGIDTGTNKRPSEPDGDLKDKDEDMHLEAVAEQPELDLEKRKPSVDHVSSQLDESDLTVGKQHPEDGNLQSAEILLEQNNEKPQESPRVSTNERSKEKESSSDIRKSKHNSHRKSLGDQSESISGKDQVEEGDLQHDNIRPEQNNETHNKSSSISKTKNGRSKNKPPSNKTKRKENSHRKSIADQLHPTSGECCEEDESSRSANKLPEKVNEAHHKSSRLSMNKKQKGPVRNRRKMEVSYEKSLEGAGTVWESGIRKITRKRMRPLEYWKGERFLYARVHDSLSSVIGLKYESPAKAAGEKPAFRVKSFVSDEYKELVDLAAWH